PASPGWAPCRVRHRAQPGGTGPGPASELRDLVRRVHTIVLGGLIHRNGRGQNPGRAAGLPVGTIPASLPPSLALTQPPPGTRGRGRVRPSPLPTLTLIVTPGPPESVIEDPWVTYPPAPWSVSAPTLRRTVKADAEHA